MADVPFDTPSSDSWPRKYRLRIAGQCRILMLGWFGASVSRKRTRPIATGRFAFPAFGAN
jgi:hypothetical protein